MFLLLWAKLENSKRKIEDTALTEDKLDALVERVNHDRQKHKHAPRGSIRGTTLRGLIGRGTSGALQAACKTGRCLVNVVRRARALLAFTKVDRDDLQETMARQIAAKIRSAISSLRETDAPAQKIHALAQANLLETESCKAVAEAATKLLHQHQKDRQRASFTALCTRLTDKWKENGAKEFFKFLRNNKKGTLSMFSDPSNNGKSTANPIRIDAIFRNALAEVYNRPDDVPPPSFDDFEAEFWQYLKQFPNLTWIISPRRSSWTQRRRLVPAPLRD